MEIIESILEKEVQEGISRKGYTILEVLKKAWNSQGNWVFLTQKDNGLFALKLSPADLSSEASLNRELKSRVLPNMVDHGKIKGYSYIVTEYCEKGTLADLVQNQGSMCEATARDYFTQALNILSYLHQQEISHLDVKPENIVIGDDNELKYIDFGHAKAGVRALSMKSNLTGTLKINSPERFSEKYFNGFSADVYSLGVLLLYLLSGSYAFKQAVTTDHLFAKYIQKRKAFFHYYQLLCDLHRGIEGTEN